MEKRIQKILQAIEQGKNLSDQEKAALLKSVENAEKEIKDKSREIEIEAALEKEAELWRCKKVRNSEK